MTKKENILMICCDGLENGGIQSVIMSIIRNLKDKFHFDIIVFTEGKQYYTEEALSYGCNIHYIKLLKNATILEKIIEPLYCNKYYKKKFKEFLKDKKGYYKAIHCHNYFLAAPFIEVAKKYKIPIRIAHSHNVASPVKIKNKLTILSNKRNSMIIKKNATKLIACSKAAGMYVFSEENIQVVNNAIDLDKFNPDKYKREENRIIRFINVGRYSFQKNQLFILDVFDNIRKLRKDVRLILIGGGELEKEVKKKIKKLELEDVVEMLHRNSDVPYELAQSDIMIFPSTYEGLGISLIEAQAMGLKCFISDRIQPEANLGLCKTIKLTLSPKEWAQIIVEDIEKNGIDKKRVNTEKYDIKIIIDEYNKIYTEKGE